MRQSETSCNLPVNGPLHDVVTGDEGRDDKESLAAEAPPGVEDGVVASTGKGRLTVGRETEADDTPLLLGRGT